MGKKSNRSRNLPCPCGSGLKRKRCHPNGSALQPNAPARRNLVPVGITAAGPMITFDQLVNELARVARPYPELALLLIHESNIRTEAVSGIGFHDDDGTLYSVWQVGAAGLAALCHVTSPPVYQNSYPTLTISLRRTILTTAGGLTSHARLNARDDATLKRERAHAVLRTLCTRQSLQRDVTYQFGLTLHLLGIHDFVSNAPGDGFCDPLFQQSFGCSALEYIEIVFGCYAIALKGCLLSPSDWFQTTSNAETLRALARRVLAKLACPATEVCKRIETELEKYASDGMVQAFFTRTPFIAVGNGAYLSAPHPFVRLAATTGAFLQATVLARADAEAGGSTKPYTNKFTAEMGRRFETFLEFLLTQCKSTDEQLIGEHRYLHKSSDLSPDFVILNSTNPDYAILIQAKLKRLSPGAFYGFDHDDFLNDAKGPLAELIWKSLRYLFRLETLPDDKIEPNALGMRNALRRATTIILLGVVPAMPSVFHAKEFRRPLEDGVFEKLRPEELVWYRKNRDRLKLWHIVDSEELATLTSYPKVARSLFVDLRSYLSSPGFGELANSNGLGPPLRDWFLMRMTSQPERPERILAMRKAFDEFCNATSTKFFPAKEDEHNR